MHQTNTQTLLDEAILNSSILIIDDEPQNILRLKRLLERANFTNIVTATDSRRILELTQQYHPDLLLLDFNMPHLDGISVIHILKNNQLLKSLNVVIITASSHLEVRRQAFEAGAKDFILKPIDSIEVLTRIKNLLQTHNLTKHLKEKNQDLSYTLQARNQMLEEEQHRLQELNNTLEEKVIQRTTDLAQANAELAQLNYSLSELVSIVSHELRTPLTAIKSFAEILRDEHDHIDSKSRNHFLNMINEESDRLTRLISEVLDLQKIQSGQMIWKKEKLDLYNIVAKSVEFFTFAYQEKNLSITINSDMPSTSVIADKDKLRQVMSNLLSNALKFTTQGGVAVTLSRNLQWAKALLISQDKVASDAIILIGLELNVETLQIPGTEQAISYLSHCGRNIDLLILDIDQADTDRATFAKQIRKQYPSMPIATISSLDDFTNSNPEDLASKHLAHFHFSRNYIETLFLKLIEITPNIPMIDIAIRDTGVGIPPDQLNQVFKRFYQVDSSQTRQQRGTGLGLTICQEIITQYQGKLWVESEMGKGSCFHVLLPEVKEQKQRLGDTLVKELLCLNDRNQST